MSIPEIELHYSQFLDKASMICGETKTGKSFLLRDILYQIKPFVDQIIVFSQTDKNNQIYSGSMVPAPMVHDKISDTLLEDIYERQVILANIYNRAWNTNSINKLFNRLKNNGTYRNVIDSIKNKIIEISNQDDIDSEERERRIDLCQNIISGIYKQVFNENRAQLLAQPLTTEEIHTLKYINLNPRLVILFDDFTEILTKYSNNEHIAKLFYQGRHVKITTLVSIHADKALPPQFKKAANTVIFTSESAAMAYFDKKSTALDKKTEILSKAAAKTTFTSLHKHQKLLYLRDERSFHRVTAKYRDEFEFCSPIVRAFCEMIKTDPNALPKNNKFSYGFS